jgi:hypothetical protein
MSRRTSAERRVLFLHQYSEKALRAYWKNQLPQLVKKPTTLATQERDRYLLNGLKIDFSTLFPKASDFLKKEYDKYKDLDENNTKTKFVQTEAVDVAAEFGTPLQNVQRGIPFGVSPQSRYFDDLERLFSEKREIDKELKDARAAYAEAEGARDRQELFAAIQTLERMLRENNAEQIRLIRLINEDRGGPAQGVLAGDVVFRQPTFDDDLPTAEEERQVFGEEGEEDEEDERERPVAPREEEELNYDQMDFDFEDFATAPPLPEEMEYRSLDREEQIQFITERLDLTDIPREEDHKWYFIPFRAFEEQARGLFDQIFPPDYEKIYVFYKYHPNGSFRGYYTRETAFNKWFRQKWAIDIYLPNVKFTNTIERQEAGEGRLARIWIIPPTYLPQYKEAAQRDGQLRR